MTRTQPWNASLEDSVFALGAAARECKRAYEAAIIAKEHVDLDRVRLLDGKVTHRAPGYTTEQEPHLAALSRIGDFQLQAQFRFKRLYEEAARAYAHGTHWAIRQVQAGQQPARVELPTDGSGRYHLADSLPALDLGRYAQADALESARQAYERCLNAGADAEAIAAQRDVSDHEAGQMHQALDVAAGLPDAAYAYGVLAEGALRFAITHQSPRE